MKRSISLKEFSNTPTVSTMVQKDGEKYQALKQSTLRSNAAMQQAADSSAQNNATANQKSDQPSELFEME